MEGHFYTHSSERISPCRLTTIDLRGTFLFDFLYIHILTFIQLGTGNSYCLTISYLLLLKGNFGQIYP
jgi:hypothetical protein